MNDKTRDIAARETTEVETPKKEPAGRETVLLPPVDIFENSEGITLIADMPGVTKERLAIDVDRDSLVIEGEATFEMPEGIKALYADIQATRYRRDFSLSAELDPDRIEASLKDGVLTLRIPKRAELRPRKIEISEG